MIHVRILGRDPDEFEARSHEILDHQAGTYHKFVMPDGSTIFHNDFGIRALIISKVPAKGGQNEI